MSIFTYSNFKENRDLILNKIAEIIPQIPTLLLSNKDTVNEIYNGLTQDIPKWYGKEKLEDAAKMINDICDAIFKEFINLIKNIVVSRSHQIYAYQCSSLPDFENKVGVQFPSDFIYEDIHNQHLFIESSTYKKEFRQLLIVQNANKETRNQIEQIKDKKDHFFALILTLTYAIDKEVIENPELQMKSREETTSRNTWSGRLLKMEIPTSSTFADVIDVILSWVYDVEEMEDKDVADWIEEGNKAAEINNYESALSAYDKAIEIDPTHYQAWYHKGLAYFRQEKYDKALESYDKALEITSNYTDALYGKALVLHQSKKYNDALAVLDKAMTIGSDNYHISYLRGSTLFNLGQYDYALEAFDKAIEIDPTYYQAWYHKGLAYFRQEKYDKALESYDKALEINPRYTEALYNKGEVLNRLERYPEAIRCFDEVLRIAPKHGDALYGRAVSNAKRNKVRNAIADLEKAIEIGKPDDIDYYRKVAIKDDNLRNIQDDKHFREVVGKLSELLINTPSTQAVTKPSSSPISPSMPAKDTNLIHELTAKVNVLSSMYYDSLLVDNKISVSEFWKDHLVQVILFLDNNAANLHLTDSDRAFIKDALVTIPPQVDEFHRAESLGNDTKRRELEVNIRYTYSRITDWLKNLLVEIQDRII